MSVSRPLIPGKFYVFDLYSGFPGDPPKVVSGPFDTKMEAEQDRMEMNVADDCEVHKVAMPRDDANTDSYTR